MGLQKRVDANQKELVSDLRKLGFSVAVTSEKGKGFPDLVAGRNGINVLLEVKANSKKKLTDDELKFHQEWKGIIAIVTCVDDVIKIFDSLVK